MTAPNGAIVFNNSTGSDTTASGMGSANVYGAGASITSGSAVVTGINTTGVVAGDLLWVQSSTGRQFSIIASVDSGTQVTCDDNFGVTESSRTWAIGGKRATLQGSLALFAPCINGATYELETDQTITSNIPLNGTQSWVTIKSNELGTKRSITQTTDNTDIFSGGGNTNFYFRDIKFRNTASVKKAAIQHTGSNGTLYFLEDCIIGESGAGFESGMKVQNYANPYFYKTIIQHCDYGYNCGYNNTGAEARFVHCKIDTCGYGIFCSHRQPTIAENTIFSNCTTAAILTPVYYIQATRPHITGCIFYNNAKAFDIDNYGFVTNNPAAFAELENCIFVNNTTALDSGFGSFRFKLRGNFFYGNSTNKTSNVNVVENISETALTSNPFVDAANGDFNLNATNGGGGTLRSTNYTLGG